MRNGTNKGVNLDGIGSQRSMDYLVAFLHRPETTYETQTMEQAPARARPMSPGCRKRTCIPWRFFCPS